jgi:hypothetical protein
MRGLEVFKPLHRGERQVAKSLAALAPRTLLFGYWTSFLIAALLSASRATPLWAVGVLAQLSLLVVWFGYPLTILYAAVPTHVGRLGALGLAGGVMFAVALVAYTEAHQVENSLINLVVFALVVAPLIAGAYGLRIAERRAGVTPRTSIPVGIIAFVFLPFLATFIHRRVSTAIRSLEMQRANL